MVSRNVLFLDAPSKGIFPSRPQISRTPAQTRVTGALSEWIITPRADTSFGWPEAAAFLLYCAILFFAIPFHEPWADEAQAWLLARDCSLHKLFFHQLHYEGTPGLWHLVLWIANRLHLPYSSMQYISAAFAAGAVYVLLRYAPLPRLFRLLLPFTFYLQYQYAVIARNYSFFALSVFVLVWLYTREKPAPVWLAVVAGLTANESMHGALFAAGLFVIYVLDQRQRRQSKSKKAATVSRLSLAAAVLAVFGGFAFWTAFPAPDNSNPLNMESVTSSPRVLKLRALVTGIPIAPPVASVAIGRSSAGMRGEPLQSTPHGWRALKPKVQLTEALLAYPISTSRIFAFAFLIVAAAFIVKHAGTRPLLPYLILIIPMVFIHTADHHAGLPFIVLLAGLWMAYATKAATGKEAPWLDAAFSALFAIVLLIQIAWTWHAVLTDHRFPYDGGEAAARYLKQNGAGKTIVSGDFMTTSVQPYFPRGAFANRPDGFWTWSTRQAVLESPERITALNPVFVVFTVTRPGPEAMKHDIFPGTEPFVEIPFYDSPLKDWLSSHYRETHRFCGDRTCSRRHRLEPLPSDLRTTLIVYSGDPQGQTHLRRAGVSL